MRGILIRALLTLTVIALLLAAWVGWRYQQFLITPLAVGPDGVELVVERGSGLRSLADELVMRGMIDSPELLLLYGRLNDLHTGLKAGEYGIAPGTTPPQLIAMINAGRVIQHALTLVEGWTFREALAAIRSSETLAATLDAELDDAAIMARLGYPDQHPEGRFFPSTYHFPRGTSDVEFLRRAHETMARVLDTVWQGRAEGLPYTDPYEALILASIVEKETGVAEERPRIAGVFVRRLLKRMRLQTDPTVIYGLGSTFDGDLRRRDLRTDTPYNSYTRAGLPPTPIALPGQAAIAAAVHPADGSELYFVARGDGSHAFSATLQEHRRAVRRFQLGGRK